MTLLITLSMEVRYIQGKGSSERPTLSLTDLTSCVVPVNV